ncbi:CIC11C00000004577 [Sungouiella intermedia]|uniref:CIC11C00000004577 n=1 Tax=Sungouiella intermedia TaxID=45354 RepID=A0A1L0BQ92_9ASCO|nr:CIC11C00000004577 [[Candida] intermedia]
MSTHPVVLWAQRSSESDPTKNILFLTIEVQDPVNTKVDLTNSTLKFSADSSDGNIHYDLNLDFFDEIDPENSKKHEAGNQIRFILRKKKAQADFWPRLLKEKLKLHYIKTDFDKWVDEDEQEEQPDEDEMMNFGGAPGAGGPGDLDFSQLLGGGAGGAGGPGGNFDISQLANQLGQSGAGDLDPESDDDDVEDEEQTK